MRRDRPKASPKARLKAGQIEAGAASFKAMAPRLAAISGELPWNAEQAAPLMRTFRDTRFSNAVPTWTYFISTLGFGAGRAGARARGARNLIGASGAR